ncbi:MAG: hypothetical protein A3H44_13575 [Gammaproteobacteria bacterium RIFCSPLOWO2_02_FULL_57_10]|nr:MAG: hypothetical protein A3H44_13575 [Gammaproteobacteria bacterium RIFCSPLOWO2_02_FULL_57_10]
MTLHVLEFNDAGIRVSDDSGVLVSSPGYALVAGKRIEFGENARKQSRLNPLNCFNQFWHKLNLDPFARPVAHYRHNADIAFSHLQDLASVTQLEGDVLLAVPGSFSRQQLAILLGLIKQCSFRAVGVVDAGLAAAIDHARSDSVIHADIQLHQVVLSRLVRESGDLVRESVVQVPGSGWVNMSESLMQLLTAAFIQQCRFNPQHNAQSEQMLLDGLPGWLRESDAADALENSAATDSDEARRNLLVNVSHNNTVHQARVPRSSLATRLQPFFQKVSEQLKLLDPEGKSRLLVSDRLQGLPGFADEVGKHFSRISVLSADAVGGACLRYHEELKSSPDAVHFVTRLRPVEAATAQAPQIVVEEPTHFLNGHHARRLVDGLVIRRTKESNGNVMLEIVGRGARRTAEGSTVLGEIAFDSGHFSMRSTSSTDLLINGVPAQPVQRLHLGERIGLANSTATIELIRVQDGD